MPDSDVDKPGTSSPPHSGGQTDSAPVDDSIEDELDRLLSEIDAAVEELDPTGELEDTAAEVRADAQTAPTETDENEELFEVIVPEQSQSDSSAKAGHQDESAADHVAKELDDLIEARANQLREQGQRPFFWNRFSVKAIAAIGYVPCLLEIVEQSRAAAIEPAAVYVSSAGSTGAGLALGAAAVGLQAPVRNIAPLVWPWDTAADMASIANDAAERLRLPHRLDASQINITEEFIGPDYGVPSDAGLEALRLVARTESVLLDPVYSAKAFAGLMDDVRVGKFSRHEHVVFVHTGGLPALFAMNRELAAGIPGQPAPF